MGVEDDLQMETNPNSKSFRVVLQLCPPEQTETAEPRATVRVSGMNTVTVQTGRARRSAHVLEFDSVWSEEASLRDVYESTAQPLVECVMKGYNGCVMAYGPPNSLDPHSGQSSCGRLRGIISLASDHIFSSPESSHCTVRVSFYHISNEKIYDLLEPQVSEVCRIHDTEEAVLLEGLREVEVSSAQELLQVYRSGTAHRNAGVSKGDFASKSHMVFNVMVINTREGLLTASKLSLVDLASSAKAAYRSSAAQGVRRSFHEVPENLQEAKTLKRSLTIFRNVIFSLSAAGCQHVPYRESKLTRALRDCLGGNCQTCLLVTVATQSSSITETMSCLQFAAQAMSVPSRPIHTSQIYYAPAQVQKMRPAERSTLPLTRAQTLPPVSADRRSQACLPPILATSGSLPRPKPKARSSLESSESHSFLPQLEKPSPTEMNGRHGRGSQNMGEKSRPVDVCALKGAVPLSHGISATRLSSSSSSLGSSLAPGTAPECPNCKQERKIREEYDKFIIQVKRDRDGLSQRVTELEQELKTRGREGTESGRQSTREERESRRESVREVGERTKGWKDNGREERESAREGRERVRKERESGEEGKAEDWNGGGRARGNDSGRKESSTPREEKSAEEELQSMKAFLRVCTQQEKTLAHTLQRERERFAQNVLELQAELERKRNMSTQRITSLHSHTERLLSELGRVREECEALRESAALSGAQLQKEKAELISHIDNTKSCYEKVCSENAELKARLEALLKDPSRPCSGCHSSTDTHTSHVHTDRHTSHTHTDTHSSSHMHTVTTNTELLLMSHRISQQCTTDLPQDTKCCYSQCSGFPESSEAGFADRSTEPTSYTCHCDLALHKPNIYKQLRREHSLLLDVMLVLYKREWFLQDAMPYVRRTLRKCGLSLEHTH
ncbi:uncharacterized protein [Salminus brasiliensis]|uniref:uncharacterized protein isoform X2 n=1 Tax=Salminus brasiliensis TaxID=930266 RepID=UPI003B82FE61